jgi:hypothetical protein
MSTYKITRPVDSVQFSSRFVVSTSFPSLSQEELQPHTQGVCLLGKNDNRSMIRPLLATSKNPFLGNFRIGDNTTGRCPSGELVSASLRISKGLCQCMSRVAGGPSAMGIQPPKTFLNHCTRSFVARVSLGEAPSTILDAASQPDPNPPAWLGTRERSR